VKQIRSQVENTTSDYDKEKLQERLAKLVGGVAVIKVGAATETELKEKKARVEDAMHATRARLSRKALSPAAARLCSVCIAVVEKLKLHDDESRWAQASCGALSKSLPARSLSTPATKAPVVIGRIRDSKEENFGFNAETGEYGDMIKMGHHRPGQGHPPRAAETQRPSRA